MFPITGEHVFVQSHGTGSMNATSSALAAAFCAVTWFWSTMRGFGLGFEHLCTFVGDDARHSGGGLSRTVTSPITASFAPLGFSCDSDVASPACHCLLVK